MANMAKYGDEGRLLEASRVELALILGKVETARPHAVSVFLM